MQIKNIVIGQKYTKNGEEKTAWKNIGTMFIKDDGKMSIKLDMIPIDWDGNAMIFDREPKKEQYQPQQQQPNSYDRPAPKVTVMPVQQADMSQDEIPF